MTNLTLQQTADRLGYSYETVRQLVKTGELACIQRGHGFAIRIPDWSVSEFEERYLWPAQRSPRGLSEYPENQTGTSETVGNSFQRAQRMKRRLADG